MEAPSFEGVRWLEALHEAPLPLVQELKGDLLCWQDHFSPHHLWLDRLESQLPGQHHHEAAFLSPWRDIFWGGGRFSTLLSENEILDANEENIDRQGGKTQLLPLRAIS